MNPLQYPTAYKILHSRLAVNPRNPFESVSTSAGYSSMSYRQSGTSMFTFEEYCVIAVATICGGIAMYQLSSIYKTTRNLSPTLFEMLDQMYWAQKSKVKRVVFPVINKAKPDDILGQREL